MDELVQELREKYKPNSNKSKQIQEDIQPDKREAPKLVATSGVRIRKKSPGRKFLESFIAEDAVSIKDYILYDVLLPAFKNTVIDAVTNSIQMVFWGENRRPGNSSRMGGRSYISYGNYSSGSPAVRRDTISQASARRDIDDIILASRGEAEEVLSNLVDLTLDYGRAAVSDLYYMVGLQSTHTDQKWGWKDLSSAYVERVRDGYRIKLPKVIAIN